MNTNKKIELLKGLNQVIKNHDYSNVNAYELYACVKCFVETAESLGIDFTTTNGLLRYSHTLHKELSYLKADEPALNEINMASTTVEEFLSTYPNPESSLD